MVIESVAEPLPFVFDNEAVREDAKENETTAHAADSFSSANEDDTTAHADESSSLPRTPDKTVMFTLEEEIEENDYQGPSIPEEYWYDGDFEPDQTTQGIQVEYWVKHTGTLAGTDPGTQNYLIRDGTGLIQVIPFNLVIPFQTGTTPRCSTTTAAHDDLPADTAAHADELVGTSHTAALPLQSPAQPRPHTAELPLQSSLLTAFDESTFTAAATAGLVSSSRAVENRPKQRQTLLDR